jgi:hypothetical protein
MMTTRKTQVKKMPRHGVPLLPIGQEVLETFLNRQYEFGVLPQGSKVYRYGSDETQARWSRGAWVNVTEDLFHFTDEALEKCALLDATFSTMHARPEECTIVSGMPKTANEVWRHPHTSYETRGKKPAEIWNTAAWRATLIALDDVPVYVGIAGPMAFDLSTGKRYRGLGDQAAHRTYPGGASQILITGTNFDKFMFVPPERMQWTRWPQHH